MTSCDTPLPAGWWLQTRRGLVAPGNLAVPHRTAAAAAASWAAMAGTPPVRPMGAGTPPVSPMGAGTPSVSHMGARTPTQCHGTPTHSSVAFI